MISLIVLFCLFSVLLFHTYFGYYFSLILLTKLFGNSNELNISHATPSIALVIAAYNEESVIRNKLINSVNLEYPSEQIAIWVVSDGSSDKTNEIVKELAKKYTNINLLELSRQGKSNAINNALKKIKAGIVIFSDANTMYDTQAAKQLIKYFVDKKVGCVCGRLQYYNPNNVISGKGEGFYWRYEVKLKILESELGYTAGANGAIYAIRHELFEPLPTNTINDDFTISMKIVEKGYKSLYNKDAVAFEDVAPTVKGEFKRHIRDGAGHYIAICHLLRLLNPFLGLKSYIYWSHRVLRWLAPFLLILIFVINLFLANIVFYNYILLLQLLFYLLALSGLILAISKYKKIPFLFYVPFYFCNLNLALLLGFIKAVTGKQKVTWDSTERSS